MQLYHFSRDTHEFTGEFVAPLDPLETDIAGHPVYLRPACATEVPPPACGERQVAVWTGSCWDVRPDHRGETWITTERGEVERVTVGAIGDPHEWGLHHLDDLPKVGDKQVVTWNADAKEFALLPDHRGELWYDAERKPVIVSDVGDPHDIGLISAEELAALPQPIPSLSPVQIRLQLLTHGIDDTAVEAAIAASGGDDIDRKRELAYWHYATCYERGHPLVEAIGAALGFSHDQLDDEFRAAAKL